MILTYLVSMLANALQEIVRLDVTMNKIAGIDYTRYLCLES